MPVVLPTILQIRKLTEVKVKETDTQLDYLTHRQGPLDPDCHGAAY